MLWVANCGAAAAAPQRFNCSAAAAALGCCYGSHGGALGTLRFLRVAGRPCVRPLSQQLKDDNKTLLLVVREKSALSQILACDSDLPQTIWTAVTKAEAPLGFPSYQAYKYVHVFQPAKRAVFVTV